MSKETVVLISVLFFGTISRSQQCGFGQIRKNGECRDCPPGTFLNFSGNRCTPCYPGTFQPFFRAPNDGACRRCFIDTFNSKEGATSCQPCPAGTISGRGATKCLGCGPGTYLRGDRCLRCEKATYSSGALNRACTACEFPLTSPVGSTSSKDCKRCTKPGSFGFNCRSCLARSIVDEKTGLCRRCPPGHVPNKVAFPTKCVGCRVGTFAAFARKRPSARLTHFCKPCPPGTTSGKAASVCRAKEQPCEKDFVENKFGSCVKCNRGQFYHPARKECMNCPFGTISLGGSQTKCMKCTAGRTADPFQYFCECPAGRFFRKGRCVDCPAGTGGTYISLDLKGIDLCMKCDPGFFQDKPGQPECKPCPFGMVSTKSGAVKCRRCPKGSGPAFDSDQESRKCATLETGCPVGFTFRYFWGSNCRRMKLNEIE